MSIRLVRTEPEVEDFTEQQIEAMIENRRDQNDKLLAVAFGISNAIPMYTDQVIPGLVNVDHSKRLNPPEEDSPYAMEWKLKAGIQETAWQLGMQVIKERGRLIQQHRIVIPEDEVDAATRASFKARTEADITALLAARDADTTLWVVPAVTSMAGLIQYLNSIGKDWDYIDVTLPDLDEEPEPYEENLHEGDPEPDEETGQDEEPGKDEGNPEV